MIRKFVVSLLPFLIAMTLNHSSWGSSWDKLVEQNGLFFHGDTNKLFTGKVVGEKTWRDAGGSQQTWSEGIFVEGKKDGLWKIYCMNGQISSIGSYVENHKNGDWKWYYCSGELMRTFSLVKGKLTGSDVLYHSNGIVWRDGHWANGQRHGEWLSYGRDGSCHHIEKHEMKSDTGTFKSGIKISACTKKCGCPNEEKM